MGRGAGVLFVALDHEAGCVAEEAAELVGEPRDKLVLLVQSEAWNSHGLLREELNETENGLPGGSRGGE